MVAIVSQTSAVDNPSKEAAPVVIAVMIALVEKELIAYFTTAFVVVVNTIS